MPHNEIALYKMLSHVSQTLTLTTKQNEIQNHLITSSANIS